MNLPNHIVDAINKYVPALDGHNWAEPERRCEMAALVYEIKPQVVVEIGTFGGASAIPIAFALRESNNGGKIYCIDPWKLEYAMEGEWEANQDWYKNNIDIDDIHKKFMHAAWSHNLDNWLVVIRAASQHCYELFPKIDVLSLDGNHSEVASLRDATLYVPRVVSGGYVLVDDQDWGVKQGDKMVPSLQKALDFIKERCDLVKQSGNMGFYRKRADKHQEQEEENTN